MLSDRDRAILETEGQRWRFLGAKEAHVSAVFGLSLVRYSQIVSSLLDVPAAEAEFPVLVRRLRRLRDGRRLQRAAAG